MSRRDDPSHRRGFSTPLEYTTISMVRQGVGCGASPNKRMKLTKLSPAPFRGRRCRLMPAPAGLDAGTASQLIRGVLRTQ